ncbi:sugar transferase [Microbacterium sp. SORGH_AS_0888]|uniref:sugar transferase n=1 Tax=Microbacterium sp. SORGH_AS_0888 TaxID=3041791 RepID=UPI00278357C7|nr:sugar transferase [Microbacterium sp. SORGH_AS_0888]MDQ1130471.1 exopolysaccharide biosynthesis polyprenyl glycosylphosphotransferase [Microbacterium sp. SORGH_AS_0888]
MSTDTQVDATTESLKDSTKTPSSELPASHAKAASITTSASADRTPDTSAPRPSAPRNWRRSYQRRLWISDFIALVWVVFGTQIAWFGLGNAQLSIIEDSRFSAVSYWFFSIGLIVLWMGALSWSDSRSYRVIGAGPSEYLRVADASLRVFGAIAIVAFLAKIDLARGFLLISLPLGIVVLLTTRWLWRQWLIAMRQRGTYSARVLLVGSVNSVAQIARELGRNVEAGYLVVGACSPSGKIGDTVPGTEIPMMGSVNAIERAMQLTGADTVAVTSTDELPPDKVKQISWNLQAGRQHLVLAPSIVDIAGPRLHTRPVAGLPLIHVETPRFSKGQLFLKRTLDICASSVGVVLLSPVLAFLAMSIRLSSDGPVLFRQVRIGRGGREFTMLKFRSMVTNAEELLENLQRQRQEEGIDSGNEILFKMKNDPRVTPIGRIMRKYSLDELPQLFNVIGGSMSLVGPRPPLPTEVEQYATHVHRRFLVKPGITGLWQVSGRSTLSWEDTVRLDLSYVENWTVLTDLAILAKTAKAALAPGESAH